MFSPRKTIPLRRPFGFCKNLIVSLLFFHALFLLALPSPCKAHNVGAGLFAHSLFIEIEPGTINLDYTIEIPASVLIRNFLDILQARGLSSTADRDAFMTNRLLETLDRGLLCLWNGKEITLDRVEGVQEKTGFGGYNFFQYRLSLQGKFPADQKGKITLINRNYSGFKSVYYISLTVSPRYRLAETSMEEPAQRFLVDPQTGRPWSLWEGIRGLEIEIHPAPFWHSLVGEKDPLRIDHNAVYRKTTEVSLPEETGSETMGGKQVDSVTARLKAMLMEENPDYRMLPLAVLLAFFLGAVHALGPGHGKALVGAYLVGTRGRPLDAVFLGLLVTLAHVSSVILLGVASFAASRFFVPEKMLPYMEMASALLLVFLGAWMLKARWPSRHSHEHRHGLFHRHPHHHPGGHAHHESPAESRNPEEPAETNPEGPESPPEAKGMRWKEMLSLGISGGMVPCPSALAILLIAIALKKVALGLVMIVAFSLGLASVLVTVGLLLVWTRSLLKPQGKEKPWIAWLPVASSLLILLLGIFMFCRTLFLGSGLP